MNSITLSQLDQSQAAVLEAEEVLQMDEDSFRLFYERTARPLLVYLSRVAGDRSLAEDLMQEAYYRFLRARLPEMAEAHRKNYLFRIATNLLRDHWRSNKGDVHEVADGTEIAALDPMAERVQQQSELSRAMSRLKPQEREMLWLAYAQGSSHQEIADILGLKAASIRLLLFRARRKLATFLRRSNAPSRDAGLGAVKVIL